jgi:uncharacterized OsmC-like protein
VADALHVEARWDGGMATTAQARGHEVVADEPEAVGGRDGGMMPTELLFAGLATCYCLAVAHVANKRNIALPGLRVAVDAERDGRELRYAAVRVEVAAAVDEEQLAHLIERARPFCWVSNMLAPDIEVRYVPKVLSDAGQPR